MLKLFLLAMIAVCASAQLSTSTFQIAPFAGKGISIQPSAVRPYAVQVSNQSDDPIEAVSIRWDYTRNDSGMPDAEINARYESVGNLLNTGASKTFVPRLPSDRVKPGSSVTFSLDGVLFSSGRVAGANKFGIDKHIDLRYQSVRWVAIGVIKRTGEARDSWLNSLAGQKQGGDPSIGGGSFWRNHFIALSAKEYIEVRNLGSEGLVRRAEQNRIRSEVHLSRGADRGTR